MFNSIKDEFLVFFQSVEIGLVVWNGAEAVFGGGGGGVGGGGKGEYKMQKIIRFSVVPNHPNQLP
jgi:hypothetical protein